MESTKPSKFICHDCFKMKKCKEKSLTWLFFFIALVATVSIRAVNVVLDSHPVLAKTFWYVGIVGFFIFFVYKFKSDNILHKELESSNLVNKVLNKENLSNHDYEVIGTVLCRLRSKKDKINYFFIFFFSGVALIWGMYVDIFK